MESMFFCLKKEDCLVIDSSQKGNGLLEIVAPKNCSDRELLEYIRGLGMEEYNKIIDRQKKAKEVFRKKVKKMIDKYKEEFDLPLMIDLRLQMRTKKLNDCNVELYGIFFKGNLSIAAGLQYYPDELIEKIIRCTIYALACKYERRFSSIKNMTTNTFSIPDGQMKSCEYYEVPEDAKYRVLLEADEAQRIISDYEAAIKQILNDMEKQPIYRV